ncbi:MAG TPA: hypothetical protein DEP66_00685, partial [Acidimicrobiaceae bacterium]|nr:hypothetical protein [Acidimicrobiaceae bacterium]
MTTPTTSTRRRTRRSLAALAATVLCASVLAIVAGSPAGAANTASEGLYDHDEDANTASVRRYAGATRYSTALAVAKRFVDQANQTGLVETAIIASGTNLVDAAAAAGLAASKDAPILLTSPNRLQKAVAKFIDDEFISDIFVIGGEAAVSAAVVEDLEEIASVRSVKRLSGADRYATAAALADEVGAAGEFCNTTQIGAVLVNVDASFADVIVAGPLAYALELPILLTTVDTLPPDAAGFLTDEEIEHVVIVGGTAVVSAAVEEAVLDTGVSDTTRIAGANRYATSIEVLKAISGCNNGTVSLDSGGVALVNDASASDGIVASTILGQGLRAAGVTPALLVSDVLPTEISAYLAATPTQLDTGAYVDLSITAIGSTTSVSAAVVTAARTAATTSEPLTATISAKAGESSVSFKFSGAVDNTLCGGTTATGTSVCNRAHYRVAGGSLLAGDSVDITGVTATLAIVGDTLAAGDTITLAGGKVKGLGDDNRRVAAASFTVPKPTPDNQRPRIRIVAPVGADEFAIRITEATPALGEGI